MYLQNFEDNDDIINSYAAPADALAEATVFLAWYGYGCYCGSSLVVYEKDGKLYEVNGNHCSCSGLEDQWQPEETSWDALAERTCGSDCEGGANATEELQKIVKAHL
jgi:hypothetical protein